MDLHRDRREIQRRYEVSVSVSSGMRQPFLGEDIRLVANSHLQPMVVGDDLPAVGRLSLFCVELIGAPEPPLAADERRERVNIFSEPIKISRNRQVHDAS